MARDSNVFAAAQSRKESSKSAFGTTELPQHNFIEIARRLSEHVGTPRHQRRIADEASRRSEYARDELRRKADQMEIPKETNLRAVVEDVDAQYTHAMEAVRRALAWRGAQRRGLLLVLGGQTGVGKTAAACHALVHDERGGLYVSAQTVCSAPRTGYSTVEDRWSRWTSAPMLVIDDAGTERQRPELIRDLVLTRFDDGLITIASTNLCRVEVAERYLSDEHGRLADRLINAQGRGVGDAVGDDGQPWYVDITGASLRSVEARARLCNGIAR